MKEKELFFEANPITKAEEVEETYNFAVKNNYKFYRAVSKKGEYYGWVNGKLMKAVAGTEWFRNHQYIDPNVEKEITEDDLKEPACSCCAETSSVTFEGNKVDAKPAPFVVKHEYSFKYEYEKAIEDITALTAENKNLNDIVKSLTEEVKRIEAEKEQFKQDTNAELEELRRMKAAIKAFGELFK